MTSSYTVIISVLYLACGVFIFLLGLTILRIGRSTPPTRATALMLFFAGIGPLLSATGIILESTLREGSVVYGNMVDSFEYLWEFYFPSLMLFALVFPRENDVFRRYPVIGLVVFLPYIFHLAIMMFGDRMLDFVAGLYKVFPVERAVSLGEREVDVGGFDNVVNVVVRILERAHRAFFALVNICYSAIALFLLWRNRVLLINPRLVRQVRTVGVGLAVSVACYSLTKLSMMTDATRFPPDMNLALINFSLVAGGGTIAYAVVRQQFLGIRHIFRYGILYSGVAAVFAFLYLVIVRPVSEFFLQYSAVSREAFETGFIIVAIIAFQPALVRIEEILGRLLLKERVDVTRRFRDLGDGVTAATTLEELETALDRGLRSALDTSESRFEFSGEDAGRSALLALLAEIGEPVRKQDLVKLREESTASGGTRWFRRRRQMPASELESILEPAALNYEVYVPLVKDRRFVGYLGLTGKIYGVPYTSEELGHLAVLATQIGAALHNIELLRERLDRQLFEEELKIARKIQTQLLPAAPPRLNGFELSARTVPSRYVGGDYYDFVVVDERWLVIVVADVSGKGIPAAILTATLQAAVRSNADAQTDPAQMLARLNALLFRNTSAEEFATLFYGVVDMAEGTLRYANAGHDFPLVVGDGEGVRELSESGIVLGCFEEFDYGVNECRIPAGCALAVYTDGVTDCESGDGEPYGAGRLKQILEKSVRGSAGAICAAVVGDVQGFGDSRSVDDLTLVVLKRRG